MKMCKNVMVCRRRCN